MLDRVTTVRNRCRVSGLVRRRQRRSPTLGLWRQRGPPPRTRSRRALHTFESSSRDSGARAHRDDPGTSSGRAECPDRQIPLHNRADRRSREPADTTRCWRRMSSGRWFTRRPSLKCGTAPATPLHGEWSSRRRIVCAALRCVTAGNAAHGRRSSADAGEPVSAAQRAAAVNRAPRSRVHDLESPALAQARRGAGCAQELAIAVIQNDRRACHLPCACGAAARS